MPIGTVHEKIRIWSLYIAYVLGIIIVAFISIFWVPPLYIVGAIIAALVIVLIIKYPFFGFITYLIVYFFRIGERFPALSAARPEFVIGLLLLVVIILKDALNNKQVYFPKDRLTISILMFIGVMLFSTVFSEWVSNSKNEVIEFTKIFILYYFIVVLVNSEKKFMIAFVLITLLTCSLGLESAIDYNRGIYDFRVNVDRAEGTTSYGGNYNSLAMFMATIIPFLMVLMMLAKNWIIRFLLFCQLCINAYVIMITASRSGLMELVVGVMAMIFMSKRKIVYFVTVVLLAVGLWPIIPKQYQNRYETMTSGHIDASTQGRFDAWKAGVEMLLDKPIFGVGPGAFKTGYFDRKGIWVSSHSLYVEVFATTGLVGLAVWLYFLYILMKKVKYLYDYNTDDRVTWVKTHFFARAMFAALAVLLAGGIFGHILYRDSWFIIGGFTIVRINMLEAAEREKLNGSAPADN